MILINGSCAQRRAGVQGHDASSLFCSANTEQAVQEVPGPWEGELGTTQHVGSRGLQLRDAQTWLIPAESSPSPDSCLPGPWASPPPTGCQDLS